MSNKQESYGKAKIKLQMGKRDERVLSEAAGAKKEWMAERSDKQDPAFERAYGRMMERAISESRGERKRRLLEKHGYLEKLFAEKVWWPAIGSLDHLHPEYERRDLRDTERFSDYAYLPSRAFGLLIEADGFGPHWRNVSRWKFDDDLERQNLLLIEDWRLLRFSSDGIQEKPQRCQQTLLLALGKWGQAAAGGAKMKLNVYERAILHYSQSYGGEEMTPKQIAETLDISSRTATVYMQSLVDKGYLVPHLSAGGRRMGYLVASMSKMKT